MENQDKIEINSVQFFRNHPYQLPENILAPILIAWELSTPENFGNLLRLCDTVGFKKVVFVNANLKISMKNFQKVAGNSFKTMPFEIISPDQFAENIEPQYQLVAIETASNSANVYQVNLPLNVAFVVGSERKGIAQNVIAQSNMVVHVPLPGRCTSLNVSHAAAAVIFEWLRQVCFSS